MAQNYFLLPEEDYQRAINPIQDWIKQTAFYAAKMTGKPLEACIAHLRKKLNNKEIHFNNPKVIHYQRGENSDRFESESSLTQYLANTVKNNEILAPTLTTYLHPSVKRSMLSEFIFEGVAQRKIYKKKSQAFESEGKIELFKYFNNAQDAEKRSNNSASGGMVAEGSVINNPTGHSTLTTVTRSIASLSNASNERLISGNRHYYTPQIALNNMISICTESDLPLIESVVETYGLVYPSVDETVACIRRSTDLYFRDRKAWTSFRSFVETLVPAERAAIVYTGDLYHLKAYNEAVIRQLITDFARQGDMTPVDEVVKTIWSTDEQVVNFAHQVCISIMEGKGKDYAKLPPEHAYIIANTCKNIENTILKYKELIHAFFLSKNVPCTIATIPTMVRQCVVLSDTDSTMFTVDDWVEWYFGDVRFDDACYAVGGAVMFIATQAIAHSLAVFSANMGVERKNLFTLAMKPEFVFPVFAQTPVAKHYYTARKVKEGNVYKDIQMEIKGVHMKDSSVPTNIIEKAAIRMEANIRAIMRCEKLSLKEVLTEAADIERDIRRSILSGETTYLKWIKIKEKSSYAKDETQSPYRFYTLWEDVFAPKYGTIPPPPYQAVRVPLNLPNKTAVIDWLTKCEDQAFSQRMLDWMNRNNKKTIGLIQLPMEYCASHGIPKELEPITDMKKVSLSLTKSYRNILGSMGFFSKRNALIMEQGY